MATPIDLKVPGIRAKLIKHFVDYTFRRYLGSTVNETTGEVTLGSATDTTAKASPKFNYERKLIDGALIQENDCYILVFASDLPFTPNEQTLVVRASQTWKVVSVKAYESGENVAAYELQLRR